MKIPAHWPELSRKVFIPHTEAECQRLVRLPGQLTDEVGNDESHPLASLMEVIGGAWEMRVAKNAARHSVMDVLGFSAQKWSQ